MTAITPLIRADFENDGKEYACIQVGLSTLQGQLLNRLPGNRVVIRCNGRIHTGKAVGKVK